MKGNQPIYEVERYVAIDMNYEALVKKARYFKQDEKGVAAMCKIMEDMRNEAVLNNARETARRMIEKGKLSLEEIADCIPVLSLDELKKLERFPKNH